MRANGLSSGVSPSAWKTPDGVVLSSVARGTCPIRDHSVTSFTRRVCLRLDGMDAVTVRRNIPYGPPNDGRLVMDAYYPPDDTDDGPWPAVIIVAGYPGTMEPRPTRLAY